MLTIPKPEKTLDFQLEGTETIYSIPYAKHLPIAYIEDMAALRDDPSGIKALDFLRKVMERYAPGAWENLTQEGLALILEAWAEGLGEQQPRRS